MATTREIYGQYCILLIIFGVSFNLYNQDCYQKKNVFNYYKSTKNLFFWYQYKNFLTSELVPKRNQESNRMSANLKRAVNEQARSHVVLPDATNNLQDKTISTWQKIDTDNLALYNLHQRFIKTSSILITYFE